MAENKNKAETQTKKEGLQFTEKMENLKQYFAAIESALQLVDLTSSATKTWTVFNKDSLMSQVGEQFKVGLLECELLQCVPVNALER